MAEALAQNPDPPDPTLDIDREHLERLIVAGAIRKIHAQGFRLSDSAQSELHSLVRERLATSPPGSLPASRLALDDVVTAVTRDILGRTSLRTVTSHELVIRRRWVNEVGRLFDGVWPFTRPSR
jgi:hypothetical protein